MVSKSALANFRFFAHTSTTPFDTRDHPLPSISDIEQLRYLDPIARKIGVRFRLNGGVAFRCALQFTAEHKIPLSLFDLVPLTSDIDLVHSGAEKQNSEILRKIIEQVPDAECFRWEIRSQAAQRYFDKLQPSGGVIPARTISLTDGPDGTVVDPAFGHDEIVSKRFRYFINPFFKSAPLYRAGRDLPALSALLYLQTLFEAGIDVSSLNNQPGWTAAVEAFSKSSDHECQGLLQQHAYLRSRLRYLLINAFLSAPKREIFFQAAREVGLRDFLKTVSTSLGAQASELLLLIEQAEQDPVTLVVASIAVPARFESAGFPKG